MELKPKQKQEEVPFYIFSMLLSGEVSLPRLWPCGMARMRSWGRCWTRHRCIAASAIFRDLSQQLRSSGVLSWVLHEHRVRIFA